MAFDLGGASGTGAILNTFLGPNTTGGRLLANPTIRMLASIFLPGLGAAAGSATGAGSVAGKAMGAAVGAGAGAAPGMGPFGFNTGGNPSFAHTGGPPSGSAAAGWRGGWAGGGGDRIAFGPPRTGDLVPSQAGASPPDNTVGGGLTGPNGNNVGKGGPGTSGGMNPIMQQFLKSLLSRQAPNAQFSLPNFPSMTRSNQYNSGGRLAMQNQGGY